MSGAGAANEAEDGREVLDLRLELGERRQLSWRERLKAPDRFGVLLLLIVASLIVPVADESRWERVLSIALGGVTLVFALRTSLASKRSQRAAAVAVPVLVIGTAAATLWGHDAMAVRVGISLLATALLAGVLVAIVRRLSTHLTISWTTILGALCIYLMFGMTFSAAYSTVGHLEDGPLFAQQEDFTAADTMYFSFVTLTTVGFGDLSMRSDLTRMMSAVEALVGQIYLITAVGLLIGNLGRRRRGSAVAGSGGPGAVP